jgi:spermidine synthase
MSKHANKRKRPVKRPVETSSGKHSATPDAGCSSSRKLSIDVLIAIFLASGATSLVYETLWARELHLVFGTSQLAVSVVLAAFMAGLAMGGFAAAHWAGRIQRPVLVYAFLEAFIGFYALIFPSLLKLCTPVYLAFWNVFEPDPTAFGAFQFVLLGGLLLPPTVCMGATLPLLTRFVTSREGEAGFQVGRLYGANTLGAVLGTGLAGFWLLPTLGLSGTTMGAAAVNGLLALGAFALHRHSGSEWRASQAAGLQAADLKKSSNYKALFSPASRNFRLIMLIAALTGFASLVYEVAWFRLMTLLLGASTYSFSIMLISFLLGIGVGGWAGGAVSDRALSIGGVSRVLLGLVWIQVGVAVLAWLAMYAYAELPFAFVWLYDQLKDAGQWFWVAKLGLGMALMTPAALLMGASFAFLVRAGAGQLQGLARPVGLLYGANTVGAIGGAVVGALFLLPMLTVRGSVLAAATVNLLAAVIAAGMHLTLNRQAKPAHWAGWGLATVLAVSLIYWKQPPWNPLLMTSGMYNYVSNLDDHSREGVLAYAVKPFELLFYKEGISSVVTVAKEPKTGEIWLANNGKIDASTITDLNTQVLLAHLPFIYLPDAEKVLVIGLASGISAGSITLHPEPESIDIAEIEPATVTASHLFDDYNHRPLDDPRVQLYINDARNHLLRTPDASYDLVVSEPSNPWLTGVSNLFTREFFLLGKRKMKAGGVWAQWLQTYDLSPDDLRSLLATFADIYSNVRVFRVDSADLVLIGSDAQLPLNATFINSSIAGSDKVIADLEAIGIDNSLDIISLHQFDRNTLLRFAQGATHNTDDNMYIEYAAPLRLFDKTMGTNSRLLDRVAEVATDATEEMDSLMALLEGYIQHDVTPRRSLQLARFMLRQDPDNSELQGIYDALLKKARALGIE